MPRGRGRGGSRKSRNAAGFASDVEMKDANLAQNELPKSKAKSTSLKAKNESNRRGRLGKTSPPPQAGGIRGGKPRGGGNGWRLKTNMTWLTSRGRNNNRRLSVISSASTTLSAQDAGPWCDKCTSLNRQLHGYLLEILKHGEDAIGEWAYAVGASPDHMECEPAPERIIPEGFRRCSRQHQLCATRTEGEARTAMPASLASEWARPVLPSGSYVGQPESASGQTSTATSPYSQFPSSLDLVQRAQEPLPIPSATNLRTCHTLVAIPYTQGPVVPPQTQLPAPQPVQPPWNGGFQRPVAMYPNSGPAQNTTYPWASQHTQTTPGPLEHGGQQDLRTANNLPGSLTCNEALRNVGHGQVLKGEQDVLGPEIPG